MSKKYWLKLSEHFFNEDEIIFLESQKNGEKYILMWIKLLLRCLQADEETAGFLRFNDKIPYNDELLAQILRIDIDTVRSGLGLFKKLGMIDLLDDGTLYIEAVQKLIGKESDSAERVRRHRERKKLLTDVTGNVTAVTCNDNTSTSTNTNTSINKEKGRNVFKKPTVEEVREYCKERNNGIDAESFVAFYESKNWMIGKNKMKKWKMAIITWEKRRGKSSGTKHREEQYDNINAGLLDELDKKGREIYGTKN